MITNVLTLEEINRGSLMHAGESIRRVAVSNIARGPNPHATREITTERLAKWLR